MAISAMRPDINAGPTLLKEKSLKASSTGLLVTFSVRLGYSEKKKVNPKKTAFVSFIVNFIIVFNL